FFNSSAPIIYGQELSDKDKKLFNHKPTKSVDFDNKSTTSSKTTTSVSSKKKKNKNKKKKDTNKVDKGKKPVTPVIKPLPSSSKSDEKDLMIKQLQDENKNLKSQVTILKQHNDELLKKLAIMDKTLTRQDDAINDLKIQCQNNSSYTDNQINLRFEKFMM